MILPIYAYGHPILRKETEEIEELNEEIKTLIDNMFETMYNASGVGIAAPQIGLSIRLFIVDTNPFAEDDTERNKRQGIHAEAVKMDLAILCARSNEGVSTVSTAKKC